MRKGRGEAEAEAEAGISLMPSGNSEVESANTITQYCISLIQNLNHFPVSLSVLRFFFFHETLRNNDLAVKCSGWCWESNTPKKMIACVSALNASCLLLSLIVFFTNLLSLLSVCSFLTAEECAADSDLNFLIPVAVGVALGFLIIAVFISYMIGRRKSRTGYQSV